MSNPGKTVFCWHHPCTLNAKTYQKGGNFFHERDVYLNDDGTLFISKETSTYEPFHTKSPAEKIKEALEFDTPEDDVTAHRDAFRTNTDDFYYNDDDYNNHGYDDDVVWETTAKTTFTYTTTENALNLSDCTRNNTTNIMGNISQPWNPIHFWSLASLSIILTLLFCVFVLIRLMRTILQRSGCLNYFSPLL
jgi:hypothetical protein